MEEIVHKDYLRVTIRSTGSPFKGFLIKAVEVLNTDTQCKFVKSNSKLCCRYDLFLTQTTKRNFFLDTVLVIHKEIED